MSLVDTLPATRVVGLMLLLLLHAAEKRANDGGKEGRERGGLCEMRRRLLCFCVRKTHLALESQRLRDECDPRNEEEDMLGYDTGNLTSAIKELSLTTITIRPV